MFNDEQEHIDRIVDAIHNPPKEILDALIALDNAEDEKIFKSRDICCLIRKGLLKRMNEKRKEDGTL